MDTGAKSNWDEHPKGSPKTRIDRNGRTCPPNTYLRYSPKKRAWVYHAKFKVRGVGFDGSTEILECAPGSREAAIEWVETKSTQLLEQQAQNAKELATEQYGSPAIVVTENSKRWVINVCKLELDRYIDECGQNSPNFPTVKLHLARMGNIFGHERDASTLTQDDIKDYRLMRREQLIKGGQPPTYNTIRRELASFNRAIVLANEAGIFNPPYVFPINRKQWTKFVSNDPVDEKQRSHQFSVEDCQAWQEATKGTRLEHFVYMANKTGMRSVEMQYLRWKWVHRTPHSADHYALIRLPEYLYKITKLDKRPIPIPENVYRYLERLAAGKPSSERLLGRIHNASDLAQVVGKRLGRTLISIDQEPYEKTYLTLRDLRASAGRRVYEFSHQNLLATQIFMRHKDIKTTMNHYVRPSTAELAIIAKSME